jgi:LCCL domain
MPLRSCPRLPRIMHSALAYVLLVALVAAANVTARQEKKTQDSSGKAARGEASFPEAFPEKASKSPGGNVAAEVRFTENSNLKLILRDEAIDIDTRFGKLSIPVAEIRQVEFATRIPDETAKQVNAAIADLASGQFRAREAAMAELRAFKEKAYPALLHAAKHSDPEVMRRAEELLTKLRETVPEEMLEVREQDVLYTDDMKIAGRIGVTSLRVRTTQFGEQYVKLSDLHSLRSLVSEMPESVSKNVLPDPGNLARLNGQIGKTFSFRVTGAVNGQIWGTKIYTSDSLLATAAVHAGLLQPGQTGVVRVTIVAPPGSFTGSTANGVTSGAYGPFQGAYRLGR